VIAGSPDRRNYGKAGTKPIHQGQTLLGEAIDFVRSCAGLMRKEDLIAELGIERLRSTARIRLSFIGDRASSSVKQILAQVERQKTVRTLHKMLVRKKLSAIHIPEETRYECTATKNSKNCCML